MSIENIKQNYEKEYCYNSLKSKCFKFWYYFCAISSLLCSLATIPVVACQNLPKWISIVTALLTALFQGCNHIFNFHERWIYHRNLTEILKSEYRKYSLGIFSYKNITSKEKDVLFSENIETIIQNGVEQWRDIIMRKETEK